VLPTFFWINGHALEILSMFRVEKENRLQEMRPRVGLKMSREQSNVCCASDILWTSIVKLSH